MAIIDKQQLMEHLEDDLELLELTASMVAIAINNSRIYKEMMVTSKAQKKFIKQITQNVGNIFDQ